MNYGDSGAYTCGVRGLVMNELGEFSRCRLVSEMELGVRRRETRTVCTRGNTYGYSPATSIT